MSVMWLSLKHVSTNKWDVIGENNRREYSISNLSRAGHENINKVYSYRT